MRHHFHRCGHLRVLSLEASDVSRTRKGGAAVLEELCEARGLAPCVGLIECTVLAPPQKRQLLALRATRRLDDEGVARLFEGERQLRARELEELRRELVEERERIVEENRRIAAELAAALDARGVASPSEEAELAARGISVRLDDQLRAFRGARLDAIEAALEAMRGSGYGACARCGEEIDAKRLRASPDTGVCSGCAQRAEAIGVSATRGAPAAQQRE